MAARRSARSDGRPAAVGDHGHLPVALPPPPLGRAAGGLAGLAGEQRAGQAVAAGCRRSVARAVAAGRARARRRPPSCDRATRVVGPLMPNSSPERTSSAVLSRGGSMPSSVLATTERAVSGRRSAGSAGRRSDDRAALTRLCHVLKKCNTQEVTANSSAASRDAAGPVHPARRAAHRSAAGVGHAQAAAPRRACAASPTAATCSTWRRCGCSRSASSPWPPGSTTRSCGSSTFLLMGRAFALYAILGHEAAHRLLFSNRRANDLVGQWGLAYPAFVPFDLYRRSHFAHHKDEMGPNEPDLNLYLGYPVTRASLRRKLRRDARRHRRAGRTSRAWCARSPASRAGRSRCASSPPRSWWPCCSR